MPRKKTTYVDENNNKLDIHILFPFKVEKYGNTYIAYTVDRDKNGPTVEIYLSKVAYLNDRIKVLKIGPEEEKEVLKKYEQIKREYKLFE